jgi:hypothetical protein
MLDWLSNHWGLIAAYLTVGLFFSVYFIKESLEAERQYYTPKGFDLIWFRIVMLVYCIRIMITWLPYLLFDLSRRIFPDKPESVDS